MVPWNPGGLGDRWGLIRLGLPRPVHLTVSIANSVALNESRVTGRSLSPLLESCGTYSSMPPGIIWM